MAGGRGFEPRLMGPEPIVLPLNDPPVSLFLTEFSWKVKGKQYFTAVFHAQPRAGHPGNIKMPYQTEQDKSPLAPLYERGVKQEAPKLPPL